MSKMLLIATLLVLSSSRASAQKEWAAGISYTTSWDEAIKMVEESGKLLFIYNGWEKPNI